MKGTPKMATFGVNNNLSTAKSQETSASKTSYYNDLKKVNQILGAIDSIQNGETGGQRLQAIASVIAGLS